MELLLVRHGIAADRDPHRWPQDADRPLTGEGEARFREVAKGLSRIVPSIEAMLASPYARAWRTAEILAEEAGWPAPKPAEALEADKAVAASVEVVRAESRRDSLALVGHEPNLSELASLLLTGSDSQLRVEMKKGGVACLSLPARPRGGDAVLRWVASPKMLRGLAG